MHTHDREGAEKGRGRESSGEREREGVAIERLREEREERGKRRGQ